MHMVLCPGIITALKKQTLLRSVLSIFSLLTICSSVLQCCLWHMSGSSSSNYNIVVSSAPDWMVSFRLNHMWMEAQHEETCQTTWVVTLGESHFRGMDLGWILQSTRILSEYFLDIVGHESPEDCGIDWENPACRMINRWNQISFAV